MANPNPFDYITSSAARCVPGLPGQAWADPDSPIARMAAGKPATDGILAQMTGKTTNGMGRGWVSEIPALTGLATKATEAANVAVKNALPSYLNSQVSFAAKWGAPEDLMRGVKVATGIGEWGYGVNSLSSLAPSVATQAWGPVAISPVLADMMRVKIGNGISMWERITGPPVQVMTTPLAHMVETVRRATSMPQLPVLKNLVEGITAQTFPPGWASPVKGMPTPVPLSYLGAAATDYVAATRRLRESLGVDEIIEDDPEFIPTAGDEVYQALAVQAPHIAEMVDAEAATVETGFWQRRAVRNSLAAAGWAAWGAMHATYFALLVIFPSSALASPEVEKWVNYGVFTAVNAGLTPKGVKDRVTHLKENPIND